MAEDEEGIEDIIARVQASNEEDGSADHLRIITEFGIRYKSVEMDIEDLEYELKLFQESDKKYSMHAAKVPLTPIKNKSERLKANVSLLSKMLFLYDDFKEFIQPFADINQTVNQLYDLYCTLSSEKDHLDSAFPHKFPKIAIDNYFKRKEEIANRQS